MNKHTIHRRVTGAGIAGLLLSLLAASGGGALSLLAGCGGKPGSGSGGSSTSSGVGGGDGGTIPTSQRATAATNAATSDSHCTGLPTAFYWEIGDANGTLVHGQAGAAGAAIDPSKSMVLASASKWIFGAYALEKQSLDAIVAAKNDVYLNFTSPYHNFDDLLCVGKDTVAECNNGQPSPADAGKFFYNGGHLQYYAVNVAGLGNDCRDSLIPSFPPPCTPTFAGDVQAAVGPIGLTYSSAQPAGGGDAPPSEYAAFLRLILGGKLAIGQHLGADAVCAWTHFPDCDALYSPVNESKPGAPTNDVSDEKWHYSIAHWVEPDGTFSSPGKYGFYPWIDASKTWYGVLARYDNGGADDAGNEDASGPAYYASALCGRAIRNAWLTGQP